MADIPLVAVPAMGAGASTLTEAAAAVTNPNRGIGTATAMPPNVADYQTQVANLRAAGQSQDQIDAATQEAIAGARGRGNSEADIQKALGVNDPTSAHEIMRAHGMPRLGEWTAPPPEGMAQSFTAGVENSAGGLRYRGKLPEFQMPANAGFTDNMAYQGGTLIGGLADMVVGGAEGAAAGLLAGAPTGPGEAAIVPTATMVGAFALPAMERKMYMDALIKGQVASWKDFASRSSAVAWEGIKAATIARFTAGAGQAAIGIGGPVFTQTMRQIAAETSAMTATSSLLEGHVPTWSDLGTSAATLVAMHAATAPVKMSAEASQTVMTNLADRWVKTGEAPRDIVARAANNEALHQELMLPKPPEPPPLSSETSVGDDHFVIGKDTPETNETTSPVWEHAWDKDTAPPQEPGWWELDALFPPSAYDDLPRDLPRSEIPPNEPNQFEKGLVYYDFANEFQPLRWSESKQKWSDIFDLTPEDWAFQEQLHEPPVNLANSDYTSWWHGSRSYSPSLDPAHSSKPIKAVWLASDRDVAHDFGYSGTITRVYVKPGKYFDFRDPEQLSHIEAWLKQEYGPALDLHGDKTSWIDTHMDELRTGHFGKMETKLVQKYLADNGYEGYFEREDTVLNTAVNLAVYKPENIIKGGTTAMNSQAARIGHYEAHSPNQVQDMARPGTMVAVYEHGSKPAPNTIHPLEGYGDGGFQPPPPPEEPSTPPPPGLPPTDAEAWRLTAEEMGTPLQPGWYTRLTTTLRDAYRVMMNASHPIMQMMDRAMDRGIPVPDANNPLFLNRLAARATTDTVATQRYVMPMLKIIKPFMRETGPENFWTYTNARTRYFDSLIDRPNPPDAAQVARWEQVMNLGNGKYADAFDDLRDLYNSTLDQLEGGRYSSEQIAAMKALGDAGLPLMRLEEEGAPEHAAKGSGGAKGVNTVFTRKGSDLKVLNQGHAIISRMLARTATAALDARDLATVDLGMRLGEARPVGSGKVEWTPAEMDQLGLDLRGLDGAEDGDVTKIIAKKLGWDLKGDDVITYKDGVATQTRFMDPGIPRLINNLDEPSKSILARIMTPLTNFSRSMMTTANPLFAPKIMLGYDQLFQRIVNPEGRNSITMALTGFQSLFNPEDFQRAVDSGAIDHVFHSLADDKYVARVLAGKADPAYTANVWNVLSHPIDGLRAWGSMWFHAMPMGRFTQGINEGESSTRAAAMATNAQFDPAAGGGPMGRYINTVMQPFFKAQLTNLERTGRSLFGIGRDLGGEKFDTATFVRRAIPFVTVPFVQNYLANRDKQWYIDAPDWQKNNGLLFRVGGDDMSGHTVYYAFPPLLGLMFGGLPRMMIEAIGRGNDHAFDHLGSDVAGALAPPAGAMTYSVMLPILEKLTNHSFFRNSPLNPDTTELPQEKFTPYTTWTAKKLSSVMNATPVLKWGNMTPVEIDNFVNGWTGSAGRFMLHAAEKAASYTGAIQDKMPAEDFWNWPGLASFNSRWPAPGAQPIQDFEGRMKTNAMYQGSMASALAHGDAERFRELTGQDPTEALLHKFGGGPTPGNAADFLDSLDAAVKSQQGNLSPMLQVLRADQLMKLERQAAGYIGNLPNETDLSMAQKSTLMGYQRAIASMQPGLDPMSLATVSAVDKKQLLDRLYATMSVTAQAGIAAMDKAGMK